MMIHRVQNVKYSEWFSDINFKLCIVTLLTSQWRCQSLYLYVSFLVESGKRKNLGVPNPISHV